jgi:hypothetical protein
VIVISVFCDTGTVVMLKVEDCVAPAGMVTVAGAALTVGSELANVTTALPTGAGPVRTTRWYVEADTPPVTVLGDSDTEERVIPTTRVIYDELLVSSDSACASLASASAMM